MESNRAGAIRLGLIGPEKGPAQGPGLGGQFTASLSHNEDKMNGERTDLEKAVLARQN